MFRTGEWTDYAMSAWVNLGAGTGASLSLLGRVQDDTHYYRLELRQEGSGYQWSLFKREWSVTTELGGGAIAYTAGTWLQLRLTFQGSTIKAESSINGTSYTQLVQVTNTRYLSGKIGLRTWNDTVARFDDVLVTTV